MLLWLVVAVGFVACLYFWYRLDGITLVEASTLLVSTGIVFALTLNFIYDEVTRDQHLISGNITSKIHRSAFSYRCGKNKTCHEPERWILEQRSKKPEIVVKRDRQIGRDGTEQCLGECAIFYPAPLRDNSHKDSDTFLVSAEKFNRTRINDPSALWREYFNPVKVSDEVVYNGYDKEIPYFKIDDFNSAHRLIAPNFTKAHEEKLERINAELQNKISVGLIITPDNLYFEKLRHAWHQGKSNDFVIVINSPDGKAIRNINILGWDNYNLKEKTAKALMQLSADDIDLLHTTIHNNLAGEQFVAADFKKYHFVNVKIPDAYYFKILIFITLFFAYMLTLLHLKPNTKYYKLPLSDVAKMWKKGFTPPHPNWNLHPLTPPGLFLYIVVPMAVAKFFF